jgi:hypothetical protein
MYPRSRPLNLTSSMLALKHEILFISLPTLSPKQEKDEPFYHYPYLERLDVRIRDII